MICKEEGRNQNGTPSPRPEGPGQGADRTARGNVIVLGGVQNHIHLIEKLKARGYHTLLADYLDHPVAADYADEHIQISTFDVDAIRELAKERHAVAILNGCLEHLNKGISLIGEELGLPVLYSYETALNVSNKQRMKRIMRDNGIPTTPFVSVRDTAELADLPPLRYPLFVKPEDGSGSTGVNRVEDPARLKEFTEIAIGFSKNGAAIIEEEAVGKECNVYCVIRKGQATLLTLSEKYSQIGDGGKVTKAIGSLWPAQVSDKALENMRRAAQGIADAFRLDTTPMFMQLMVNGDEINIIEFACRMAGGYSYWNILHKLQFDYFDVTIDACLGSDPKVELHDDGLRCAIHSLYASDCVFGRMEGLEALLEEGVISDFSVVRPAGTRITGISANKHKLGFFIVRDRTVDGVLDRVKRVYARIEAYDTEGRPVLLREPILDRSLLK